MNNHEVTLLELSKKLVAILHEHPELKDKRVSVCTEGGYAGAHIAKPIRVYTTKNPDEVFIFTDDDSFIEDSTKFTVYE